MCCFTPAVFSPLRGTGANERISPFDIINTYFTRACSEATVPQRMPHTPPLSLHTPWNSWKNTQKRLPPNGQTIEQLLFQAVSLLNSSSTLNIMKWIVFLFVVFMWCSIKWLIYLLCFPLASCFGQTVFGSLGEGWCPLHLWSNLTLHFLPLPFIFEHHQ